MKSGLYSADPAGMLIGTFPTVTTPALQSSCRPSAAFSDVPNIATLDPNLNTVPILNPDLLAAPSGYSASGLTAALPNQQVLPVGTTLLSQQPHHQNPAGVVLQNTNPTLLNTNQGKHINT